MNCEDDNLVLVDDKLSKLLIIAFVKFYFFESCLPIISSDIFKNIRLLLCTSLVLALFIVFLKRLTFGDL